MTTEFTKALSSGKNAPDIAEVGNAETPTDASLGMLANITSDVSRLVEQVRHRLRHARQRHAERRHLRRAWFGGVRGIFYRTDQFKAAGITSTLSRS